MLIKRLIFVALCITTISTLATPVFAGGEKNSAIYHAFRLETGIGRSGDGANITNWDFNGWVGTDENRLWIQSEGENESGITKQAELWTMYGRNISTFWDAQIGLRHDFQSESLSYGVIGLEGLAPYFFETEAHLFLSEDGDISARIRQENDFLITQRLISQPYLEANFFAQDIPELEVGEGLSSAEFGLQMRYEYTRKFAPYIDIRYERKFGETSSITKRNGEDNDAIIGAFGLRFLF